ncbi:MAG: amino acid ABC transporter permease [Bacillota bacterium]
MDWSFIISKAPVLAKGAIITVEITAVTVVAGSVLGLILALARFSLWRPVQSLASFYTWAFRGTPLLMQLFFIYYGLPQFGLKLAPFPSAVIGLSLNAAAYIAEIIRAAIKSIDIGQMEAARSLGMTRGQSMRLIILPQAYRRLLPPMANEFIALLKDSSLVSTIQMVDLMRTAKLVESSTFRPFEIYFLAGLCYLFLTSFFSVAFGYLEKRVEIA